jgi:hypothetical protein
VFRSCPRSIAASSTEPFLDIQLEEFVSIRPRVVDVTQGAWIGRSIAEN